VRDAAFLEDARKQNLELDPLSEPKVAEIVQAIVSTPPEIIQRFREINE
jgi:hypothetical protein